MSVEQMTLGLLKWYLCLFLAQRYDPCCLLLHMHNLEKVKITIRFLSDRF